MEPIPFDKRAQELLNIFADAEPIEHQGNLCRCCGGRGMIGRFVGGECCPGWEDMGCPECADSFPKENESE